MYIIFLMISVIITVAGLFLGASLRAVHSGQYDYYTPAVRMLVDNETEPKAKPDAKEKAARMLEYDINHLLK